MDFVLSFQVLALRHVLSGFITQPYIAEANVLLSGNETTQ